MERRDCSENTMVDVDASLYMLQADLMNEAEFRHLIPIIRGEAVDPIVDFWQNYECDKITGCSHFASDKVEYQELQLPLIGESTCHEAVGATNAAIDTYDMCDIYSTMNWNSLLEEEEEEEDMKGSEEDNSSETATTNNGGMPRKKSGNGAKGDRARTLISERKRRSRMKEMLYALRALVPNITKMDKASIVGDAARYVQDLQTQAKNLRAEIAVIESSLDRSSTYQKGSSQSSKKNGRLNLYPVFKTITKMDMFQVEERGYYVRLTCNTGRGIAVSLHKAIESITNFDVQNSSLATVGDSFVLTFTLNVKGCEMDMNLPNLKLWVAGAFLNQGFQFNTLV